MRTLPDHAYCVLAEQSPADQWPLPKTHQQGHTVAYQQDRKVSTCRRKLRWLHVWTQLARMRCQQAKGRADSSCSSNSNEPHPVALPAAAPSGHRLQLKHWLAATCCPASGRDTPAAVCRRSIQGRLVRCAAEHQLQAAAAWGGLWGDAGTGAARSGGCRQATESGAGRLPCQQWRQCPCYQHPCQIVSQ